MGKKEAGAIKALGENVEAVAGKAARAKVMAGAELIAAGADPAAVAAWLKGAMERLDAGVPAAKRTKIREACGRACAEKNKASITRAKALRRKHKSVDAFLAAEEKKPLTGTRLVREGGVLHWFFTPASFSPPRRCFCAFMHGLPAGETVSKTYCLCSGGFAKTYWEAALDRPVAVRILGTALTGATECEFEIRF